MILGVVWNRQEKVLSKLQRDSLIWKIFLRKNENWRRSYSFNYCFFYPGWLVLSQIEAVIFNGNGHQNMNHNLLGNISFSFSLCWITYLQMCQRFNAAFPDPDQTLCHIGKSNIDFWRLHFHGHVYPLHNIILIRRIYHIQLAQFELIILMSQESTVYLIFVLRYTSNHSLIITQWLLSKMAYNVQTVQIWKVPKLFIVLQSQMLPKMFFRSSSSFSLTTKCSQPIRIHIELDV